MWVSGGAILAIRLATLTLRLALTLWIAGAFGLAELGRYGLIAGLAALVPAAAGMGLNFHLCRDIVGGAAADRVAMIRDRMRWTVAVLTLASITAASAWWIALGPPPRMFWLALVLLWAEALAMDAYLALTALRANVLANIGVALRTAAWVPLAIGLGCMFPGLRALDTILACWIAGHLVHFGVLALWLRRRGFTRRWRADAPTGWPRRALPRALPIWSSDVALAVVAFGDRFVLAGFVDDAALGLYVFYWTFANMIQTLVQSALVTPSLPRLIAAYGADPAQWWAEVRQLGVIVAAIAVTGAAALLIALRIGHAIAPATVPWQAWIALPVFAAVLARYAGDVLSTVLNSAGAVRDYAGLNLAFAVAMVPAVAAGAAAGGVGGAALANLAVCLLFAGLKWRAVRQLAAGPALIPRPAPSP